MIGLEKKKKKKRSGFGNESWSLSLLQQKPSPPPLPRAFPILGFRGPLILDISSDEETVFGDARKGGGEFGDKEDGEWLSKLLVEVDGNIDDDSDDVVFLSEVLPKTHKKPSAKVVVGDDDDCVVLDGDPDTRVVVVNNNNNNKVDDDDDLEIVGEKGEIACRDFPHPRHLCAKHLFASTRHEVHCAQCHCYVCDSLAPCPHWGTGINCIDHCHASDKDEYWRTERKHVKNPVKKFDKPVSDIRNRIDSFFQPIQVPGCASSNPNSLPKNQGLNNPVPIRPCALSSNVNLPNAPHRIRSQAPGYVAPSYNSRTQLVSVQSHPRSTNTVVPRVGFRNKNHPLGIQNPQSFPRGVFKRTGLIGTNNRHACQSQLSRDPPLNRRPAFQAPVTNGHHGSNQHIFGSQAAVSVVSQPELSSHSVDAGRANYLPPSEPQINSQPYSSCQNPYLIPHQSQMPSQPSASGYSLRPPPLQPYIYPQPITRNINSLAAPEPYIAFVPDSHVPSQTVASCQLDAGNAFEDRWLSRSTISSGSSMGNDFCQLQEHNNPTSSVTCGQNDVQHQFHTQSGVGSSPKDFGFLCDSSVNHGNMQIHAGQSQYPSAAPTETSPIQTIQHDQPRIASVIVDNRPQQSVGLTAAYTSPINDQPSTASVVVDNRPQQSVGLTAAYTSPINDQPSTTSVVVDNRPEQSVKLAAAYTSPINGAACELPESRESGSFDFHFLDSWMFDDQSFTGAVEASASPNWNVYSPETAFADTAHQ